MADLDDWVSADATQPSDFRKALSEQFPWTAGIDVNIVDSTGKGDPSRKLEFYQSTERDNPTPGKPTIEVFDKGMSAKDLMGELLSHHLPKVDSGVAKIRESIIQSMTPQQIESIRGDYENEKKAGLVDPGDDLKGWLNKQGGDSFFRGYPTGQWPASDYTDQQKSYYGQLEQYLAQRFGNNQAKGLINMPTPSP